MFLGVETSPPHPTVNTPLSITVTMIISYFHNLLFGSLDGYENYLKKKQKCPQTITRVVS